MPAGCRPKCWYGALCSHRQGDMEILQVLKTQPVILCILNNGPINNGQ